MDSPMIPSRPISLLLRALLFLATCFATPELVAQTQSPGTDGKTAPAEARKGKAAEARKNNRDGAGAAHGADPAAGATQFSAEYQASLRQTVERRRSRRARRQQNAVDSAGAVGAIVPWPMPPALIIRHTSEVHGDVGSLLYGLRK